MAFAIIMSTGYASGFADIDWNDLDNGGTDEAVTALPRINPVTAVAVAQLKREFPRQRALAGRESLAQQLSRDAPASDLFQFWHEQTHERAPPRISKTGDLYVRA
jgi:hypothetical protein